MPALEPSDSPTLVYIYGPPASGKLTVAERLRNLTGYALFHNHLTVNALVPVFPFGSEPFASVLHRLRLDVFETAARAGISLIFTNNSVWGGPNPRRRFAEFADHAARRVSEAGGQTLFVSLAAPLAVLEQRVSAETRKPHGKLVDPGRLRELVSDMDPSPLHPSDLTIDTSLMAPDEAARLIAEAVVPASQHGIGPTPAG